MKEKIRRFLKKRCMPLKLVLKYIWISMAIKAPQNPKKDIPIIINNFNQLDYLQLLLSSLEKRGYENIVILDNDSTYPPLLEFYKRTSHRVIYLGHNYGYLALWKSGAYKEFNKSYFVYTDPDLYIDDECPEDFMDHFLKIMKRHPLSSKVGFSLRIDNLPDYFELKERVVEWESQYWIKEVEKGVYSAPIDTTFALYRPYTKNGSTLLEHHLRVGKPYSMQHLPWYVDKNNLTDNMKYYISHTQQQTHWTEQLKEE